MSKRSKHGNWRPTGSPVTLGERLRALGVAALLLAAGCAAWLFPMTDADAASLDVVIKRVMTSNPQVCFAVDGEYYDWVELQNIGDAAVDLAGWKLTDTGDLRDAYVFPSRTLDPGDTLVVYCDDVPEGYGGDAIFTGFKLSPDGELLLLADPSQRAAAVNVPALRKGFVYRRDPDTGEYAAGPLGELSDTEKAERAQAVGFDPNEVMISELMPVGRSILADADGDFPDWIEIYNPKSEPVSLEGWALTDDDIKRAKWVFPAKVLQPGEYLVVFASGKNRVDPAGELHTNFRLSAQGETVRLSTPAGDVVSQIGYEHADADQSLTREADGSITVALAPSPGRASLAPGEEGAEAKLLVNATGLYINEIYFGSAGTDWVELHNASDQAIDLSGAGLSDNPGKPRKWQFPDGAGIQPNGYVVVALPGSLEKQAERLASATPAPTDAPEATAVPEVHPNYTADFGLTAGETVCLSTPGGKLVDRVALPEAQKYASMGRADGFDTLRYFGDMTPGAANASKSYGSVGREVALDPAPGVIHESSVALTMSCEPGVDIYYTTDGSTPTADSKVYTGPITLEKNTVVKAIADPRQVLDPQPKTASYIFGPHTLRLVSVTGRAKDLTRSDAMFATGVRGNGCDVYVEIYEDDGTPLIGQACHLALTGHNSRTHNTQKSFKLNARRAYGDTRFRAPLFSKRDYDAVKSLSIRSSGQDYQKTHMLDSILTSLAEGTNVFYQETEVCVVYLNGEYWGLYNMREHVDSHSICQYEGWADPDAVTIIKGDGDDAGASQGSSRDYKAFWKWLKNADLTRAEDMDTVRQSVVLESYLDFVALEMYTNNQDLGNIRCYRSEAEDPRWRYVLFDLDLSFMTKRGDPANNVTAWLTGKLGSITTQDPTLFRKLMQNAEVRDQFLTRMGELLATNLCAENVVQKIEARRELIKDEMVYNCKRWKWKYADWEKAVDRIVNYAKARPGKLIGYIKESFKLSDADVMRYFGEAIKKLPADAE
ncbi:MAG: lamin tail domain-containing protein [Clostridia bacterium]|nr:lamin tail domain-containing protein [Clostridia bacterium]